jgi:type I restriction enzyme, S subunit
MKTLSSIPTSSWPLVPLVSEVKFLSGGTPTMSEAKYWDGDIPWVSSGEMTQRRIKDTRLHVNEDGAREGSKLVPAKTVLVVVRGMSLAKEFRVAITARDVTFNQDLKALLPSKKLNPEFLFYYLLSQNHPIRDSASESAHGTKKLDTQVLEEWPLPLPPLSTQEAIAAILSAYDDLIENNNRRILLLEKLAEELYREWFVRLRFPGFETVDKIKGVPAGWNLGRFCEIVDYYIGGGWGEDEQSATFSDPAFVIRGTDIPDLQSGSFDACPYRFHTPSNLKSRTLQPHDFVFEVSGGSKDQLLGRNVMITERVTGYLNAPVIAASFCKLIRFRSSLVSPYFMKYFMKLYYDYDLAGIYQVQSTGISNYQFESFLKFQTIILPPTELQQAFEDQVKPLVEMRDDVALSNMALRKTRNLLLPRLISGKLSVENMDIQHLPGVAAEMNAPPIGILHA